MKIKDELNQKEKKWIADLKRVLNNKPKDIEVVIDDTNISIYPTGTLSKHLESAYNYAGIGSDPNIMMNSILSLIGVNYYLIRRDNK